MNDILHFLTEVTLVTQLAHEIADAWRGHYVHKPWKYVGVAWRYRFGQCNCGAPRDSRGRCASNTDAE